MVWPALRDAEPCGNDAVTTPARGGGNRSDSMFTYGAVVANAPQYSFILQGIQQTDRSGSTGTWS